MSYEFENMRIELTQIKTGTGQSMKSSNVLNSEELYEVECEFIKNENLSVLSMVEFIVLSPSHQPGSQSPRRFHRLGLWMPRVIHWARSPMACFPAMISAWG